MILSPSTMRLVLPFGNKFSVPQWLRKEARIKHGGTGGKNVPSMDDYDRNK